MATLSRGGKEKEKMNPLRWTTLFTLILLVGVMVAVVAATEQKTPDLTLTSPGAIEPAALYAETAPRENAETEAMPSRMVSASLATAAHRSLPKVLTVRVA